jgi:hypothetical protein
MNAPLFLKKLYFQGLLIRKLGLALSDYPENSPVMRATARNLPLQLFNYIFA